jgi:hypothetical protein
VGNIKARYLARTAPKWGSPSALIQWRLLILRGAILIVVALGMVLFFGVNASGAVVTLWFVLSGVLLAVGVLLQFRNYRAASRTLGVRLTLTSFPPSDEAKYVEWCQSHHLTPYSAATKH